MRQSELGRYGEDIACSFLESKGYHILERNFRCRMGEIDIISRKDQFLCFAEVKLRKNSDFGEAKEFVTLQKQNKIRMSAEFYLGRHQSLLQPRFDVIEVYTPLGMADKAYVRIIEDAFA